MLCGRHEAYLLRSAQQLSARIAAAELCAGRDAGTSAGAELAGSMLGTSSRFADKDLCSWSAEMVQAAARCRAFLRRESCADELTFDRPGAPTTTLRKLQLTMMMIYDERCDAVTYGNM